LIGNTEYTMNSVSYGWWLDNLYQFNDPDILVFGNGADTNAQQSRLINGAVTGIFLDGDDVTTAGGQQGAHACLTNVSINAVARQGRTFTPVEGNTGSTAENFFSRPDGSTWLIAVFNYTTNATNETVSFPRAGLPAGAYTVTDLWSGSVSSATNSMAVSLNESQARLFRLTAQPTPQPVIRYAKLSGGNFIFGGSNGLAYGPFQVCTATNLRVPFSNWSLLSTGSFDLTGGFNVTDAISPAKPQVFYLLKP
jgi:alpha-galactosidase